MDRFLQGLGENMGVVAIAGSIVIAMIGMTITQILGTWRRERSRREVAAYVAEGSMTTDEAERILAAGQAESGCVGRRKRRPKAEEAAA